MQKNFRCEKLIDRALQSAREGKITLRQHLVETSFAFVAYDYVITEMLLF